jgi:multiple antibiotic resistance protein
MLQDRVSEFITLWVVIDPLGSLPIFLAVTAGLSEPARRQTGFWAVGAAFLVLTLFLVGGQLMFTLLDVPLRAFQIAGGIVLFIFALQMIFGPSKEEADLPLAVQSPRQRAVFPLAIPAIASPGAMLAVVLLTDDARHNVLDQAMTWLVMACVLALQLGIFMLAGQVHRIIGDAGASVISRVMGMILASVAVTNVVQAISEWLSLPPL